MEQPPSRMRKNALFVTPEVLCGGENAGDQEPSGNLHACHATSARVRPAGGALGDTSQNS